MRIGFPGTGRVVRHPRAEFARGDAASGASFELPVARDEALTAFHYSYAYTAAKGVTY
jgi:hypothetical protein